jgi:tetratricopeptide (TPR) repeat protein
MPAAQARRLHPWLLMSLGLLLVGGVYVDVVAAPFLWDDHQLLATLPAKVDARALFQPFWLGEPGEAAQHAYFRPLTTLSFVADRWLHADNPAGYHLTNVALHLLATGLLFGLLRRRRVAPAWAVLASLSWALLPRLTEAVAWVSGRGDVLAGVLSLLALSLHRPAWKHRLLASGVALLALLAKESAMGVVVALLILELPRPPATPRAALVVKLAPLAVALGVYLLLRASAGALMSGASAAVPWTARLISAGEAVGRYAWAALDPLQPRTFIGRVGAPSFAYVALGAATLVGAAYLLRRARSASVESLAYLGLGLVPLALVLHLVPLPISVVAADRYLYLPSLGLLLAGAPAFLQAATAARRPVVGAMAVAAIAVCGVRSHQRVADYSEEARFWISAVRTAPSEDTALVELGSVALRAGCLPEAYRQYTRAIELGGPASTRALSNAALVGAMLGKREQAASFADALLRLHPQSAAYQLRRAVVALNALDFDAATRHAERARELDRSFTAASSFATIAREVEDAWVEARRAPPPPAVAPLMEWRALRYPEALARLEQMLGSPASDVSLLTREVELVVGSAPPEAAAVILRAYQARAGTGSEVLAAALGVRLRSAALVRARIEEYEAALTDSQR